MSISISGIITPTSLTLLSVEITKIGTFVCLLRLLHPPRHRGVVDPELLGSLLERVIHRELPDLLLELVQALLASLLVASNHGQLLLHSAVRCYGVR